MTGIGEVIVVFGVMAGVSVITGNVSCIGADGDRRCEQSPVANRWRSHWLKVALPSRSRLPSINARLRTGILSTFIKAYCRTVPATSLRNFTPTSIEDVSGSVSIAGLSVGAQIEKGPVPGCCVHKQPCDMVHHVAGQILRLARDGGISPSAVQRC